MADKWTKQWPCEVGYYWMWSAVYSRSGLDNSFIVEVCGGAPGVPIVFFMGGEGPKARAYIEREYGRECEWSGPIQPPSREDQS